MTNEATTNNISPVEPSSAPPTSSLSAWLNKINNPYRSKTFQSMCSQKTLLLRARILMKGGPSVLHLQKFLE